MEYQSNHNIVYSCKYHVVWCPKYRRRVLTSDVEERLKAILREVAQERQAEIIELEVMPDHVHLLIEGDPPFGSFDERTQLPSLAPRVSLAKKSFANTLDKRLLCLYGWGCSACRHQAI